MITSALGNLICAIAFVPAHVAYAQRPLAEIAVHAVREQAAVARARGIPVVTHPTLGFDLNVYVNAPFEVAVQALVDMGEQLTRDGLVHWVPSILQDLLAGRKTELEATLGFVCAEARGLGVPTPYCDFAFNLIQALQNTHGERLLQPR